LGGNKKWLKQHAARNEIVVVYFAVNSNSNSK